MDPTSIFTALAAIVIAFLLLILIVILGLWLSLLSLRRKHQRFVKIADKNGYAYTLIDEMIYVDGRYLRADSVPKLKEERDLFFRWVPTQAEKEPALSAFQLVQRSRFPLFQKEKRRYLKFVFDIPLMNGTIKIFEYGNKIGSRSRKRDHEEIHGVAILSNALPNASLTIRRRKSKADFDLPLNRGFNRRFGVSGHHKAAALEVLTDDVVQGLLGLYYVDYDIELVPQGLLLHKRGQLNPHRMSYLQYHAEEVFSIFTAKPQSLQT